MISSLTFVFGFDQTFERFPRIWKFNKYFKKLHFYQNWSFYFQNILFSYKDSRLVELITNYCTSELIIWTDCSWLQPILTALNNLNGLQMSSTFENCLQLLKMIATEANWLQAAETTWTGCNCWNRFQVIATDCKWLKLSEFVTAAEIDCYWLQGIVICWDYLNWLHLLKPIARDCNWLDLTYSGEFWNLNGHMIS